MVVVLVEVLVTVAVAVVVAVDADVDGLLWSRLMMGRVVLVGSVAMSRYVSVDAGLLLS